MHLQNLTEKLNPNVTFKYIDDSEGDKNRGWQVDKVEGFLNGANAGYLKISYIPRERFEKYYPGILNFVTQIGGTSALPYDYKEVPWQKIPMDKLRTCIYHIALVTRTSWDHANQLQAKADIGSDDEVRRIVYDLEKEVWKEKGLLFNRFKKYYVDKPLVDYIKVEDQYKRQGIGTALYNAGQKWMKSKGMTLYASGLQSDEAKATWKSMEKLLPIKRTRPAHPQKPHARITRRYFA